MKGAGAGLAAGAFVLLGVVVVGLSGPVGRSLGPTCAVAYRGTSVTVAVRGWSSAGLCTRLHGGEVGTGRVIEGAACEGQVDGNLVRVTSRGMPAGTRRRVCDALPRLRGGGRLPPIAQVVRTHVVEYGGSPLAGVDVAIRGQAGHATTDAAGEARVEFPSGLDPDVYRLSGQLAGYVSGAADLVATTWQAELSATIRLGYLAPSGTYVFRRARNRWDVAHILDSESSSATGSGEEISFDCATRMWEILPVFVGRLPNRDVVQVYDIQVPITGVRALPAAWVRDGAQPDFPGPPPAGTC
jgi:hypothetical protein